MDVRVEDLRVSAYSVPTDFPEADGTFRWNSTTMVLVEVRGGGEQGIGYSYTSRAAALLIRDLLADSVTGREALDVTGAWERMRAAVRNVNAAGLAMMAVSAVDTALWDLKARLLGVPLVKLLGAVRESVEVYGSGGFTSYSVEQLCDQLGGWTDLGISRVKMKVGTCPEEDVARACAVRERIGPRAELFVDANGACSRKEALRLSEAFAAEAGVSWFEEPVATEDLAGMRLLRDRAPAALEIAGGEYGFDLSCYRRMLEAGAVDVLQADATRCGGITGLLRVGALCSAFSIPLSAHTAPSLHLHPACALPPMRHVEYFHDHARIERLFFDGAPDPAEGQIRPDLTRPGLGLDFRRPDAEKYALSC